MDDYMWKNFWTPLLFIIGALVTIFGLTRLVIGEGAVLQRHSALVICHANEEPTHIAAKIGDYGPVSYLICYTGDFNGPPIQVLFVD